MNKKAIVSAIYEYEKNNNGWLIRGYNNDNDFINDLIKEENFDELLKYYQNSRIMSNKKESSNYMLNIIDMIRKY